MARISEGSTKFYCPLVEGTFELVSGSMTSVWGYKCKNFPKNMGHKLHCLDTHIRGWCPKGKKHLSPLVTLCLLSFWGASGMVCVSGKCSLWGIRAAMVSTGPGMLSFTNKNLLETLKYWKGLFSGRSYLSISPSPQVNEMMFHCWCVSIWVPRPVRPWGVPGTRISGASHREQLWEVMIQSGPMD